MGDFNIDLLKFNSHNKTHTFLENMISTGLLPLITKPTRVTEYSATLIDHIYTNKYTNNVSTGILITDISDHFGTFCIIGKNRIKSDISGPKYKTVRNFSDHNLAQFKSMLRDTDFTTINSIECPNASYNCFIDLYQYAFEKCFPLRQIKLTKKHIQHEPWISKGLIVSSRQKCKLYKHKLKKPTDTNIAKYKHYCKLYNRIRRAAKRKYYSDSINKHKGNLKATWQILNKVMQRQSKTSNFPEIFKINGTPESNSVQIADAFNNFFTSIATDLNSHLPISDVSPTSYIDYNSPNSFFNDPITTHDIISASTQLKPKLTQGNDNISTKILKCTIDETKHVLTHIFNQSFSTGIVPDKFKVAKVLPIFKNGDNDVLNNYRPISILPAFSKLLEKIMYKKLFNYIDNNNILNSKQYGFRPKHSTIHPLLQFIKHITENNDKRTKDLTLAIFLDLSKAFDTISHRILLDKLYKYGIRGVSNKWFESYLEQRTQYVEFKSIKSRTMHVNCGVPQGSILGPLLFLIYINDLPNCTNLNILSFADDTTLYCSGHNVKNLFELVNRDLKNVQRWLHANRLFLNIKKTSYMTFSANQNYNKPIELDLYLNNTPISYVSTREQNNPKLIKFLGVIMDDTLSWNKHIDMIASKISRSLYVLNKIKNILPTDSLRTLYFTTIQCHLNYCILAWGNGKSIIKLHKLHKRAVRIITKSTYRAHSAPLFKTCNILQLNDLYKIQCCLFIRDFLNNNLPSAFDNYYLTQASRPRTTRQIHPIYTGTPRTNFSKNLPYQNIATVWNNIGNNDKSINSRTSLKLTMKKDMIAKYNHTYMCDNPRCLECTN